MHVHDVLIVGGGPSGFAVAARLNETMPAANFTDEEHQRYHWIRKNKHQASVKNRKTGSETRRKFAPKKPDILVLDESGEDWMAKWNRLFKTLEISHLRSPMFFHVDPQERDGLLGYTFQHQRLDELKEIRGCVGKEVTKHQRKKREKAKRHPPTEPTVDERDRKDYFVPSTPLFTSHCKSIIDRYGLHNQETTTFLHEKVADIRYSYVEDYSLTDKIFTVESTNGETHHAKIVVLAIGGNPPVIPANLTIKPAPCPEKPSPKSPQSTEPPIPSSPITSSPLADDDDESFSPPPSPSPSIASTISSTSLSSTSSCCSPSHCNTTPTPSLPPAQITHILSPSQPIPPLRVSSKKGSGSSSSSQILILGGGLTSAQIADLLLRNSPSISKIHLLLRSSSALKTKPFDLGLEWVGKFRNFEQAAFWTAGDDVQEKWDMIGRARQGGSVNSGYRDIVERWVKKGKIQIWGFTEVEEVFRSAASGKGKEGGLDVKVKVGRKEEEGKEQREVMIRDIDHIYCATGTTCDFEKVGFLRTMSEEFPVKGSVGGLPIITEDMAWNEDLPMFVTGRMAGLQLGPGGGNLIGARMGADRVAWGVQALLDKDERRKKKKEENGVVKGGKEVNQEEEEERGDTWNYLTGMGSRYDALTEVAG